MKKVISLVLLTVAVASQARADTRDNAAYNFAALLAYGAVCDQVTGPVSSDVIVRESLMAKAAGINLDNPADKALVMTHVDKLGAFLKSDRGACSAMRNLFK
ncbi:hypothetical protein GCM10007036_10630 [Alsobacter metallidurans]|uniref:Rap1a immunity protein domain-containing protein n=1 Tax=Alsobacter metallidurans TaxID=340221 RepID=A0A917I599_9HYPH|nr:hypothetical protein [Alsobacter metallidurans]GGH12629.1 hypothetical protein GCM10007036_10630 [Alsobacter metallidurans]